ncbi:MerR family DNA-binding transcriptional regulator [Motiliproteus coralliicola]|uniref:MerR family DNA-binding transcriptional regulator n=1 Tax=Motiliproteus coralliicola TaxID=2283196 RepID=A0A369WSC3_9GAMM|nr:MerR family DNA-binding transcriptional regulator [Motiliproteus coralliicola]RDE25000.1 MerR family DNA-binding transcriptional regulator [Motiliproteus coralliicola]
MEKTYSISDLSREFEITTRSIRFYEDQGLLEPTRRGQTRVYSKGDRVRLKLIMRGKRLGFSLAEIREIITIYDTSPDSSEIQLNRMLSIIEAKKQALEQQIRDIAMIRIELETTEERCRKALEELHQAPTKDPVND